MSGCGALGESGGGANSLPVSGGGPFAPLDPSDVRWSAFSAPFVLQDSGADLDQPFVLAHGVRLAAWVAAARTNTNDIERADSARLEDAFGELSPVLAADQAWEMGAVDSPSLIAGDLFVSRASWML